MPPEVALAEHDPADVTKITGLGPWATVDAEGLSALRDGVNRQYGISVGDVSEMSGTPVRAVHLTPAAGEGSVSRNVLPMTVYLGAADGFLRKFEVRDPSGTVLMDLAVQKVVFDVDVPDSLFAYAPPAGTKVGDGNAVLATGQKPGKRESKSTPGLSRQGLEGKPAPDFSLRSLEGVAVSLEALRGKPVLLDFWATWCPPCVKALPHIQAIHQEFEASGLVVLGINSEPPDKPRSFLRTNGYTFTTLTDQGGRTGAAYGVRGIPTTLVIDSDGIVRSHTVGYKTEAELRQALTLAGVGK